MDRRSEKTMLHGMEMLQTTFSFCYIFAYMSQFSDCHTLLYLVMRFLALIFVLMSQNKSNFLFSANHLIQQPCGSTLRFPCGVSIYVHYGTTPAPASGRASNETCRDRERNPLTEAADRHRKPPLWYYPCGGIHRFGKLFTVCKCNFHVCDIDERFFFAFWTI